MSPLGTSLPFATLNNTGDFGGRGPVVNIARLLNRGVFAKCQNEYRLARGVSSDSSHSRQCRATHHDRFMVREKSAI
jgi:hypothetical protein